MATRRLLAEQQEAHVRSLPPIPDFPVHPHHLPDDALILRGGLMALDALWENVEVTRNLTHGALVAVSARSGIDRTALDLVSAPPPLPQGKVRVSSVGALRDAGFGVIPTLYPLHCSVLLPYEEHELETGLILLVEHFSDAVRNPRKT